MMKVGLAADWHRLVYTIIVLMVNIIGFAKINPLILMRLHKREQRKDVVVERVIFLCSLERFISKSLQDRNNF